MQIVTDTQTGDVELCLDFANTLAWHASDHPQERLHSYSDLVSWAHERGLLDAEGEARLRALAEDDPKKGEATVRRAIVLREVIYRIFAAHAHEHHAALDDIATLNEAWAAIAPKARISMTGGSYHWGWIDNDSLDRMVWPIVWAAVDLLTNEPLLDRVGQCADDRGCGWLFLDMSKNHSRRWCDINDCGNRAKQRRYQQRQRQDAQKGQIKA